MNNVSKKFLPRALTTTVAAIAIVLASFSSITLAGEADVINVKVTAKGDNRYRFDVTLEHSDTGWDHYANKWDVLTEDGELLGTRVLAHPHVNEMPFTRSLTLTIPANISVVVIRAGDSVHEEGGAEMTVELPSE